MKRTNFKSVLIIILICIIGVSVLFFSKKERIRAGEIYWIESSDNMEQKLMKYETGVVDELLDLETGFRWQLIQNSQQDILLGKIKNSDTNVELYQYNKEKGLISLGEYELPCTINRVLAFENKKLYIEIVTGKKNGATEIQIARYEIEKEELELLSMQFSMAELNGIPDVSKTGEIVFSKNGKICLISEGKKELELGQGDVLTWWEDDKILFFDQKGFLKIMDTASQSEEFLLNEGGEKLKASPRNYRAEKAQTSSDKKYLIYYTEYSKGPIKTDSMNIKIVFKNLQSGKETTLTEEDGMVLDGIGIIWKDK